MAVDIRGMAPLLQVFDMPTSIRFYRDVLGFELVSTFNTAYERQDRPPAPDRDRIAAHADTGIFFGCPDVDAAYEYLRTRGVAAKKPKVQSYGMKQLYLTDPDGYCLCFQWPAGERAEAPQTR